MYEVSNVEYFSRYLTVKIHRIFHFGLLRRMSVKIQSCTKTSLTFLRWEKGERREKKKKEKRKRGKNLASEGHAPWQDGHVSISIRWIGTVVADNPCVFPGQINSRWLPPRVGLNSSGNGEASASRFSVSIALRQMEIPPSTDSLFLFLSLSLLHLS